MKLTHLRIEYLPGLPEGLKPLEFDSGINLVTGPNASGKTSLARALRAVLHPEELVKHRVQVEAQFITRDGKLLTASRANDDVNWTSQGRPATPPPLPDARFLSCYTLHLEDLFAREDETDAGIVDRITREMTGGYDLDAVREACGFNRPDSFRNARPAQRERREFEQVDAVLNVIQRVQQRLREEEADIVRFQEAEAAARARAGEAAAEAALVERARELLNRRRLRIELERRRAALPDDMAQLTGNEGAALRELQEERQAAERELAGAEERERAARRALDETGLAESELNDGALSDQRAALERLRALANDLEQARQKRSEYLAVRDRAVEALGGVPERGAAQLGPDTIRRVEKVLQRTRELTAERRAAAARLAQLPPAAPDDGPPAPDEEQKLNTARTELLRWLSEPSALPRQTLVPVWGWVLGAALLFMLALLLSALLPEMTGAVVVVLVLAAGVLWFRQRRANAKSGGIAPDAGLRSERQREAERRYAESGVTPPAEWTPEMAMARLREIESELGQARRRSETVRERAELERVCERIDAELERERAPLAELAREVNFDPVDMLGASFDRWLHLTADHDQADDDLRRTEEQIEQAGREFRAASNAIADFLRTHGEQIDETSADSSTAIVAETLRGRLERLTARVQARNAARNELAAALDAKERSEREARRKTEDIDKLYQDAGLAPGDAAELERRLARLEEWRSLDRELTQAEGAERSERERLAERADLLHEVEADDGAAFDARLANLAVQKKAAEEEARDHVEKIARIEERVAETSKGHDLEEARAGYQTARDALREIYEELALGEAGTFLLTEVKNEHMESSRPAMLDRAGEWFRRFTHGRFELKVEPGAFRARDTRHDEDRSLAELSSATRMQLLLAVRVAFAIETEQGRAPLPFFLDETLTTADPERYRAVVESLKLFARENDRQLFYLTAQPDEVAYWREPADGEGDGSASPPPHIVDLAAD